MFLDRFVYGWESIEGPLLASVALHLPVILLGRHGTAKSLVLRVLAHATGEVFRLYIAPVEDLTTLAGLPNPRALAEGRFELVPHARSVQGVTAIAIDELPRGPKSVQNLFLEIVQERTLMGQPLDVQMVVATMNPTTYAASNTLDEALADRFPMTLPVPEFQELDEASRAEMLALGFEHNNHVEEIAARLSDLPVFLERLRGVYGRLAQGATLTTVLDYAAALLTVVHRAMPETYVSPRREVGFVRSLLACAAFYTLAGEEESEESAALLRGAEDAITYGLALPLSLDPETLLGFHAQVRDILQQGALDRAQQYRLEASLRSGEDLLAFLEQTARQAVALLTPAEREALLGPLLDDARLSALRLWRVTSALVEGGPALHRALARLTQAYRDQYRRVRGHLGLTAIVDDEGEELARRLAATIDRYGKQPVTPAMLQALAELDDSLPSRSHGATITAEEACRILERGLQDAPSANPPIPVGG